MGYAPFPGAPTICGFFPSLYSSHGTIIIAFASASPAKVETPKIRDQVLFTFVPNEKELFTHCLING